MMLKAPVKFVEKRLYTRIASKLPVKIYYGNTLLARCYTANVGVGGLLVKTNDIGLTENSLIQVMFDVYRTHCLYELRIPAVVVRCDKLHIAASFENLEKGAEELINTGYPGVRQCNAGISGVNSSNI